TKSRSPLVMLAGRFTVCEVVALASPFEFVAATVGNVGSAAPTPASRSRTVARPIFNAACRPAAEVDSQYMERIELRDHMLIPPNQSGWCAAVGVTATRCRASTSNNRA